MRILVFGGDGFCGWPTALHLSHHGYDVHIVDDLSRRDIDTSLGIRSLVPIASLDERLASWHHLTGRSIGVTLLRLGTDYQGLLQLVGDYQPDAIVHFAEQRSAPFSMKTAEHRNSTMIGNISATQHLLSAVAYGAPDAHVVHLGTMGVYGYGADPQWQIPEGYIRVAPVGEPLKEKDILFPTSPGSIYHLTKSMEQLMFDYAARNDDLSITDLHQGIVWGFETQETRQAPELTNRFDYCGDYGTVLNRFLVQASHGLPLTVYGTGGQTRAFINLQDTVTCIRLAIENAPPRGDRVSIRNQMTEVHNVAELAHIVASISGCDIDYIQNPRKELPRNDLPVDGASFLELGLEPIHLDGDHLTEIMTAIKNQGADCDISAMKPSSFWEVQSPGA